MNTLWSRISTWRSALAGGVSKALSLHPDVKKYSLRLGFILAVSLPILLLVQGRNAAAVITYKLALSLIAVGAAELIWGIFFKPVFGPVEALPPDVQRNVLTFRGLLYAAVLLAFCLGL